MTTIKQVVVVEGRDDTKRLKETFGAIDTIETRGSAIDEATLERIANIIQCSVETELGGSDSPLHSSVITIVTRFAPSVRRTGTASSL